MKAGKWIIGWVAAWFLLLPVDSGVAKPPQPGPDYEWEKHHTTPEGHYVPGRWIRKKAHAPHNSAPPPYRTVPKPGANWTPPPYNPGAAPIAPPSYTVDPTPYVLAPLAGLYLYNGWPAHHVE